MIYGRSNDKKSWVPWALFLFCLYQATVWFIWVIPSRYYVGFDEGWHLEISQLLYYSLVDNGILGLLGSFLHAMQSKPPLVSLLPVPMYLLFGNHAWVGATVNLIWLLLLTVFLFRLVKYFWGEGPAFIACVSLQTMPLFPGLSRMVMAEYGTAVLAVMFMYYLFVWPPSLRRAVYLGIILGLGQLEKVLFLTYVIFPIFWSLYTEFRENQKKIGYPPFRFWLLTVGIAFLLAAPWYITNLKPLWEYTFQASYGDIADVYRLGKSLSDIKALGLYIVFFVNDGTTAYQTLLLGICWVGALVKNRENKQENTFQITIGIMLWFAGPFLIFLPSLYRNLKFMMPFFAPFSIALGVFMWKFLKCYRWRWAIAAALLLWPNFAILYASFPLGHLNQPYQRITVGPFALLPQSGYLGFPREGRWPYKEILEYVAADGACLKLSTGKHPTLGMVCDMSDFNCYTMRYNQKKLRLPVEVYWAPIGGRADPRYDLPAALSIASQKDYLVFRSMSPTEIGFTNKFNDQIRQRINSGDLPYKLLKEFPLPDNTHSLIYKRISG